MTRWTLAALGLVLAVLVEFGAHVRGAEFVYEDERAFSAAGVSLLRPRGLAAVSWRLMPITPQHAHAVSLGLHLLTVAALGALVWRLTGSGAVSWGAAAIFALHPLQIEPAAYAAARGELIATLGVLLACLCATTRSWAAWALLPACVALGLGGKESAIVAGGLVPLTLWAQGRLRWWMVAIAAGAGLAVAAGIAQAIGYPLLQLVNVGEEPYVRTTAIDWLLLQGTAAYRLIVLSIVPLWLTVDPDVELVPVALQLGALVILAGLVEVAWRQRTARPLLTLGIAWMVIGIVPRLIVQTPRSVLNAHQWNLLMVGPSIVGAALIAGRWRMKERMVCR